MRGVRVGSVYWSIGQRVRVQKRRQGSRRAAPRCRGGNQNDLGLGKVKAGSLVGEEEECLVPPDRPAEESAEVVVMLRRARQSRLHCKPVVGVHHGIAKVIVNPAMHLVRARPRGENHLPARRAAEFRRKRRSLNPELLQRLHGGQAAGSSQRAEGLRGAGSRLS